jgi:multiple antibiotic resistance protein
MDLIEKFFSYFITMFVIIDPVGVIPIFVSLTYGVSKRFKKILAYRAVYSSIIIVLIFAFLGSYMLKIFGIDISAFKVAGGIVLFILSMEMLLVSDKVTKVSKDEKDDLRERLLEEQGVWIVPLAIPALTGPVTMSSIIIFSSQSTLVERFLLIIACIISLVIAYYLMVFSDKIISRMGIAGINATSRIMGIILLSIAIKICLTGLKELWNV